MIDRKALRFAICSSSSDSSCSPVHAVSRRSRSVQNDKPKSVLQVRSAHWPELSDRGLRTQAHTNLVRWLPRRLSSPEAHANHVTAGEAGRTDQNDAKSVLYQDLPEPLLDRHRALRREPRHSEQQDVRSAIERQLYPAEPRGDLVERHGRPADLGIYFSSFSSSFAYKL